MIIEYWLSTLRHVEDRVSENSMLRVAGLKWISFGLALQKMVWYIHKYKRSTNESKYLFIIIENDR